MLSYVGSESSLCFRPWEMRADSAEGDSGGYRVGELCDGPHGGKGHKPRAEGSRIPHQSENPQEGRGQGSCSLRA